VAFSPDCNTLASGSDDSSIIVWNVETRQRIGEPLLYHKSRVTSVAFSPDGSILASNGANNTIILWDVNPRSWVEKSCQRASRDFTRAEWALYIPDELYPTRQEDATYPQWPLEPED
jgi:WD40 repeat protein